MWNMWWFGYKNQKQNVWCVYTKLTKIDSDAKYPNGKIVKKQSTVMNV